MYTKPSWCAVAYALTINDAVRSLPHQQKGSTMGLFSRGGLPEFVFHRETWQDFPALVAQHWIRMATDGWTGYVSYGRGYVGLGEDVNFSYVPNSVPALAASHNPE